MVKEIEDYICNETAFISFFYFEKCFCRRKWMSLQHEKRSNVIPIYASISRVVFYCFALHFTKERRILDYKT